MYGHKSHETSNQLGINNSVYNAHLDQSVTTKTTLKNDPKATRK